MNFPLISILVAVYNAEPFLTRCLNSIQAQTFQNFEVILVDDASTDHSLRILETYVKTDSRFKLVRHEKNEGMVLTRTSGIAAASGLYATFLDADDELLPDFLQKAVPYIQEQLFDIIFFGITLPVEKHIPAFIHAQYENYFLPSHTVLHGKEIFETYFLKQKILWRLVGNFYKTEFLKRYNEFNLGPCILEDLLRMTVLLYYAGNILYLRESGYLYHYGCGISGKQHYDLEKFKHIAGGIQVFQYLEAFFSSRKLPDAYRLRLNQLKQDACLYTFHIYEKLNPEDREEAFKLLENSWGIPLLSKQVIEFYYSATHSMSWKMTAPLRRLYNFLKYDLPEFLKRLTGQRRGK